MLRRLYDKVLEWANHRHALPALAGVSFAESSFFPIPPDIMLIPMILAERSRALLIALVCTIASVAGGALGYYIGYALWDVAAAPLLDFYGYLEKFEEFKGSYNEQGAWIVFMFGLTPFPYKVITIASGATALNIWTFLAASVAARGLRFFILSGLLYFFGPTIKSFIDRYFALLTFALAGLVILGFVGIKYVL